MDDYDFGPLFDYCRGNGEHCLSAGMGATLDSVWFFRGMDIRELKQEFGDRLCFHGLLDGQTVMPSGTPEEVVAEARRLVEIAGVDGGLALAPSNACQVDVPVENILAVYDTFGAT